MGGKLIRSKAAVAAAESDTPRIAAAMEAGEGMIAVVEAGHTAAAAVDRKEYEAAEEEADGREGAGGCWCCQTCQERRKGH